MITTAILTALLSILFYIFYRIRREGMKIFKKMGIPGPEPNFLFGNLLEFKTTPLYIKHKQWREEFGETFGYFEGPTPVLVTSNVQVLQEVFIKQFNKFHARKLWPVQVDPDKDEDVHMFFARGRRWKRLRSVVNPAFSAAKMRRMAPAVNECINHLLDVIRDGSNAASDKTIELLELFRRLTLNAILKCEVGLDQNMVKNPDDLFLKHCKGVIEDTTKMPWLYLLGSEEFSSGREYLCSRYSPPDGNLSAMNIVLFPNLHCVWIAIYKFLHNIKFNPVFWLEDRMREVVVMRRNLKNNNSVDLMQQMLDAQFPTESVKELEKEESKRSSSTKKIMRSMTNEEIVSHALLFLLAGFETTSTTLSYIFFELSQNPQVQQRLRHEVMTVLPRGYHTIDYDDLKKLTYMDYVIWETLRKYPLASTVTARQCMEDCSVGDMDIPAGLLVHANLWDVQYDPKHWGEDPQKFDPLRFIPEKRKQRHPAAWMPFGAGPRSCAGLRFALLQLKMVVAKVLRDFDFHPSEKLTVPLNLQQGATILPADGVHLAAMRRGSAITDAGMRRGSELTGIPLKDWVNMRRASIKGDHSDNDLHLNRDDEGKLISENARRLSVTEGLVLPKDHLRRRVSRASRSNSIMEDDSGEETVTRMRRDSVSKGISLLSMESINKGINLLRRASKGDDQEAVNFKNLNKVELSPWYDLQDTDEEQEMPTTGMAKLPEDILGEVPRLESRLVMRRGSALPGLESVREMLTIEEFKPRRGSLIANSAATELDWDNLKKESFKKSIRLYSRRGSG